MLRLLFVVPLATLFPLTASAQDAATDLQVEEAAIATAVEEREPQGVAGNFVSDVGSLYLWTRVTGAQEETEVEHVWHHEGEEIARVSLDIGSPDWRTWSQVTIPPELTGSWEVEVVAPDEEVLHTEEFTIQ